METVKLNGKAIAHTSTLSEIKSLYGRLSEGEALVVYDSQGLEIERHIMIDGKVVAQECGVGYDSSDDAE